MGSAIEDNMMHAERFLYSVSARRTSVARSKGPWVRSKVAVPPPAPARVAGPPLRLSHFPQLDDWE